MLKRVVTLLIIISFLMVSIGGDINYPAIASTTSHAFDTSAGQLSVDYSGYLSKHDVVYTTPVGAPSDGITVGNGRVGAMIWNTNGLTMQVTNVDASPQTQLSSGWLNLYTNPGMDTDYTNFEQRLVLYDGLVTTKYDSDRTVTIFGDPNSELLGIHVEDSRSGVSSVTFDLSIWDTSGLVNSGYSTYFPDVAAWRVVNTLVESDVVAISRGQSDPDKFGYTLAASVQGASFTTQQVDSRKLRINITPASSYTIWVANTSRRNSPNNDSVTQAKTLITNAKNSGYPTMLTNSKNWWRDFWSKSFARYSNSSGDADYLENNYYTSMYLIASASRGKFPCQFINGVWRWNADSDIHWSVAYWHFNTRGVYNSFIASNHIDLMTPYYNLYSNNLSKIKSDTLSEYGIDGAMVPETMAWNGDRTYTNNSDYVHHLFSTGPEVAENMYLKYKYTGDTTFLSNIAYPFMKEAVKFYQGYLQWNGTYYYMQPSNSLEDYWNVRNPATDLAAVRAVFPMAIEASQILGVDAILRGQWQNILNNISPFDTASSGGGSKYLPCSTPIPGSCNCQNPEIEIIWPHGVTGIGASDYQTAVNTWNARIYGYQIWSPDAICAARLGLGDNAYAGMKAMVVRNQTRASGIHDDGNGVFESNGLHMAGINESLLQSYNDNIRVFPALPNDSSFVGKFTLLAKGGFLVSSEKEGGEIKYMGIKSLYGNTATVVNPWGTQEIRVRRTSDDAILLTTSNGTFSFNTSTNGIYVIERTAKLLSSYTFQQLTGSPNNDWKTFTSGGTTVHLGLQGESNSPPAVIVNYSFEEAGGNTVNDSSGNGNNGTIVGTVSRVSGHSGQAISLNGGAYVNTPDSTSLDNIDSELFIDLWVYPTTSGSYRRLVDKITAGGGRLPA